ncbi:MAG: FAD-dependent oxidoreductase [Pedobacter sp.]|nr:MAG: FAD-dependent oxidoreductase [Pedobacter sp.]
MKKITFAFCCLILVLSSFKNSKPVKNYDLIIYGGTSSGVIAAYAAAKEGLKVVVLEPNKHVGGLTTSGLGHVDIGNHETVGGYTMEFLKRVGAAYGMNKFCTEMESSVAEKVYLQMIKEVGVEVVYQAKLQEKTGVKKVGNKRITKPRHRQRNIDVGKTIIWITGSIFCVSCYCPKDLSISIECDAIDRIAGRDKVFKLSLREFILLQRSGKIFKHERMKWT